MVDAALVAPAGEFGAEESRHAMLGHIGPDQAGAKGEHIGVVMLTGKPGGEGVVDPGAAATWIAVDGDGDADSRAAHRNPALGFA